jgi:hypothetical protein
MDAIFSIPQSSHQDCPRPDEYALEDAHLLESEVDTCSLTLFCCHGLNPILKI